MFYNEFLTKIVSETNRYFIQTQDLNVKINKCFKEKTPNEIRAFLGILLSMGTNKRTAIWDHFSANKQVSSQIKQTLNRQEFYLLWKYLHCSNNENQTKQSDKISNIFAHFTDKWKKMYKPSQNY